MDTATPLANPGETTLFSGAVFFIVDILKVRIGIKGDAEKVRILALVIALLFAFGDTFLALDTPPHVTPSLIWNTILRGINIAIITIGGDALRTVKPSATGTGYGDDGMLLVGNQGQTAKTARARMKRMKEADAGAVTSLSPALDAAAPRIPSAHPRTGAEDLKG